MKKLFVILAVLVSSFVNAQTIGDHLNDVMKLKPEGKMDTEKYITYSVPSSTGLFIYFFNTELRCNQIAISPNTGTDVQAYVELFNKGWVIIDNNHWKYYREDGMVLALELRPVEGVGMVFFIIDSNSPPQLSTGGSRN